METTDNTKGINVAKENGDIINETIKRRERKI